MHMIFFEKNKRNLISLFFILFVLFVINRNSTQIQIDDLVLELCYSGYFSGGTPVSDHLFQHFFLTRIFSYLYTYFSYLNWYFYLHLLFLVLSFLTMLNVLKNNGNKFYILILIVILFFLEYIYFTYTRVSFYVTFSGFLFFLKYDSFDRFKLICASLLILLGTIIRPESGILAMILFILIFISDESFKNKIRNKNFRKYLWLILGIPLIILASHNISNIENSKRFPLSNIKGIESMIYNSQNFDKGIIDIYDFQRIERFYFDERFTSEKIVDYVKSKAPKQNFKAKFDFSIAMLKDVFHQRIYNYLFLILLLHLLLIRGLLNKVKFFSIILFLFLFFIGLHMFLDLPLFKDRVIQPLIFGLIISLYVNDLVSYSNINKLIGGFILLIFSYVLIFSIRRDEFVTQDKTIKKELNKVYTRFPKGEIIFDPILFSFKTTFSSSLMIKENNNFKNNLFIPLGWAQRSYSTKKLFTKMNVEKMDDLLVKPNTTIFLDSSSFFLWVNYGEKYLNRNLVSYDSVRIYDKEIYYFARYIKKN